jgi:hypothetical protein
VSVESPQRIVFPGQVCMSSVFSVAEKMLRLWSIWSLQSFRDLTVPYPGGRRFSCISQPPASCRSNRRRGKPQKQKTRFSLSWLERAFLPALARIYKAPCKLVSSNRRSATIDDFRCGVEIPLKCPVPSRMLAKRPAPHRWPPASRGTRARPAGCAPGTCAGSSTDPCHRPWRACPVPHGAGSAARA